MCKKNLTFYSLSPKLSQAQKGGVGAMPPTGKLNAVPPEIFFFRTLFFGPWKKTTEMYQNYLQNQNLAQDLGRGLGQDPGLRHTRQSIREPDLLVPLLQCHK